MLQCCPIHRGIVIAEGLLITLIVFILMMDLVLFRVHLLVIVLILAIFFILLVQHHDRGRHQLRVVPHIIRVG